MDVLQLIVPTCAAFLAAWISYMLGARQNVNSVALKFKQERYSSLLNNFYHAFVDPSNNDPKEMKLLFVKSYYEARLFASEDTLIAISDFIDNFEGPNPNEYFTRFINAMRRDVGQSELRNLSITTLVE